MESALLLYFERKCENAFPHAHSDIVFAEETRKSLLVFLKTMRGFVSLSAENAACHGSVAQLREAECGNTEDF